MPLNTTGTLLTISSPLGIPLYAARGLKQTLAPIQDASKIARSINGRAIDFSYTQFRLYKSEISCSDVESLAFDGIWPGMEVIVECVAELSYPSGGTPSRLVVEDSSRDEGDFTFYRPILNMTIIDVSTSFDEYAATYDWSIALEETGPDNEDS